MFRIFLRYRLPLYFCILSELTCSSDYLCRTLQGQHFKLFTFLWSPLFKGLYHSSVYCGRIQYITGVRCMHFSRKPSRDVESGCNVRKLWSMPSFTPCSKPFTRSLHSAWLQDSWPLYSRNFDHFCREHYQQIPVEEAVCSVSTKRKKTGNWMKHRHQSELSLDVH